MPVIHRQVYLRLKYTHYVLLASIFNNAHSHRNLFLEDTEVDYRGYEVTAENLVRLLTGRIPAATPRNKSVYKYFTFDIPFKTFAQRRTKQCFDLFDGSRGRWFPQISRR